MVTCTNCGGEFEEALAKCPYCGQIYEPGAEQEYLKEIRQIQEDLSDLPEESEEIYQREVKNFTKKIGITLGILAAVIAVIVVLPLTFFRALDWMSARYGMDQKEALLWGNENFPQLDIWYEEGNYDAILEFRNKLYDSNEPNAYYQWKHSSFINEYEQYQEAMKTRKKIQAGEELSDYEAENVVAYSMKLLFFTEKFLYTEDDWQQVLLWQEEVGDFFYGELKFTPEEAEELRKAAGDDGYMDYKVCYAYGKKIKERF